MKLNEILNKPYDWKIISRNSDRIAYKFSLDDGSFIMFEASKIDLDDAQWYLSFLRSGGHNKEMFGLWNDNQAFKVFSTIKEIIESFLETVDPSSFKFTAKELSREKLYKRFASMLASKYNYKLKVSNRSPHSQIGVEFKFKKERNHDNI